MDEGPGASLAEHRADPVAATHVGSCPLEDISLEDQQAEYEAPAKLSRKLSEEDCGESWSIDGSNGHYHHSGSLCLVMWAEISYMISIVIIIPTAAEYAASLGNPSSIYFGLVVGITSITTPLVSRLWNSVIRSTSLNAVLLMNASICLACSLMYVLANYFGGDVLLLISRVVLGFGSVQSASLKYLGCAVSTKRVKFAHFLTTAARSYAFALGAFLAFLLSVLASYAGWNQHTVPGWFTAFLWLTYIPLHKMFFVEPDMQAAIVGPESRIRLHEEMKPDRSREPFQGLVPCFAAIFAIAVVKGSFEIMTIEMTQNLWQFQVMMSSLYLGVIMLIVALTTLMAYRLERRLGERRIFVGGLIAATLLIPFYYIPIALPGFDQMVTNMGMAIYLVVSILALSALNLGLTMAFSLTTELPSPHWKNYFLCVGSEIFTVGRGVGPILVGACDNQALVVTILFASCALATLAVARAAAHGHLHHDEHELGPACAEEKGAGDDVVDEKDPADVWVRSIDALFGFSSQADAPEEQTPGGSVRRHFSFAGIMGSQPHKQHLEGEKSDAGDSGDDESWVRSIDTWFGNVMGSHQSPKGRSAGQRTIHPAI